MIPRLPACFAIVMAASLMACQTPTQTPTPTFEAGVEAASRVDLGAAIEIWTPLAENGDMRAQYRLARLYAEGEGVEKDPAEAARLYRLAGEQGHIEAQFDVRIPYHSSEFRHEPMLGGGALMDLGCYPVHWVRTLTGSEPRVVQAVAGAEFLAPGDLDDGAGHGSHARI